MNNIFLGWIESPDEVAKVLTTLKQPLYGDVLTLDDRKNMVLSNYFRKVVGRDAPKGPQGIGDCVSWGWGNLVNYLAALQIYQALQAKGLLMVDPDNLEGVAEKAAIIAEYQEAATEIIYAFSRIEIGKQNGSMSDGSVGAWAAQAVEKLGTLSRPYLESVLGPGKGAYDKNRAKNWGANGVPDALEPAARTHKVQAVSLVKTAQEAAALVQNGYPVAVCSGQGFTMTRDGQGFCSPQGVWQHCMLIMGVRFDRPGFCISQSWGANTPEGPTDLDQPDNTFWAEWNVVDRMLAVGDSFTGRTFEEYKAQDFIDWHH